MASISINIKSSIGHGQLVELLKTDSGLAREALINASILMQSLASGSQSGVVDIQTSSTDPVAASGTITLTYANLDATDTVTIGGQVITCRASGAVAGTEFNKETDATVSAANLAVAVNANTTLSKHITATSALGVVTLTAKMKGSIGNLIVMSTSDATAYALVQMASGAGGPENAVVQYNR